MYKEYLAKFWYSAKALENSKVFFSTPTGGIYGEVRINTFRNAIGAHYIPHSSKYVAPSSIDIVRPWFETIGYEEAVPVKGTKIVFFLLGEGKRLYHTRFLSLLMIHKMKEGYGDGELTLYPTQVFSVNNWALKTNQPKEPPFTNHILAICAADMPVVFKAPKTSSKAKSVSQGTKLGAKSGHKKLSTSLKQPSVSGREATKGGSSKAPTSFKTGHSKKRKESSSAMDSNPSQPPVSTPVDTGMHKEEQQATGGPTSLGITSEARANPQLSRCDASADSTTKADPELSAPSDFIPQQHGMNEGTKNNSYDHLFTGTDPHVLADKTKSFRAIKLENLAKLVPNVKVDFKDLDSLEDDPIIVVDDSEEDKEEDKNEEIHSTTNDETEYISASTSPSPRSIQLQELKNQVLLLQSQKHTLETKKTKVEAEITRLKAQPSFPNVASVQANLKTIDAILGLLLNVTKALNKFTQVLDSASIKAGDQGVPSAGQADTMPTEGEKNTNQATIS
ncbi:hypothetical protein Tco_0790429 [Tanacetum coccineum]